MTKRVLTIIALTLCCLATATAQKGLQVARVFEQYGHQKGCKMVELNDTRLRGYELKKYVSLSYRGLDGQIEPLLEGDRKQAKKIREVVNDGKVVSGYYQMEPLPDGTQRYVLFAKAAGKGGAVVYIEGRLSPDEILKLCYQKRGK